MSPRTYPLIHPPALAAHLSDECLFTALLRPFYASKAISLIKLPSDTSGGGVFDGTTICSADKSMHVARKPRLVVVLGASSASRLDLQFADFSVTYFVYSYSQSRVFSPDIAFHWGLDGDARFGRASSTVSFTLSAAHEGPGVGTHTC
jgi:hypothetical protein